MGLFQRTEQTVPVREKTRTKPLSVTNLGAAMSASAWNGPFFVLGLSMLACSGDWVHVQIALVQGMTPLLRTDAPVGTLRGLTDRTCAEELRTCDFKSDTPWSPPAPLPPEQYAAGP